MQATQVVTSKPWYLSKTVWFNALAGVGVLVDWIATEGFAFVDNPVFAAVVTGVNLALRFMTSKPVGTGSNPTVVDC